MMRDQLPLMQEYIEHEHAAELSAMSQALDDCPNVLQQVEQDLVAGHDASLGRRGLSADQVVRALVIKQLNGFSYAELAFHLADSTCYRRFCRIGSLEKSPSKSTLQENIKRVSASSLEAISRQLVLLAKREGIETGDTIRGDCTPVESTIHPPTDSWLLWDTERVLIRELKRSREFGVQFTNHKRRVKRLWLAITNVNCREDRALLYRDLVKMVKETLKDAQRAISTLSGIDDERGQCIRIQLQHYVDLGCRVVDQSCRRVFEGESVPSQEKIVSIFETHTDILVKGRRKVDYGHKICLTTGVSSMVLDCMILEGNPADKILATEMIRRHQDIYGEAPSQAAFDGGFASKANVVELKAMGVEDIAFSKRCGLAIHEMVTQSWIYKRLRDFRAGIEGCISFLKRSFGLSRCSWKGFQSFKAYVWGSILSANLLIFARHKIASAP